MWRRMMGIGALALAGCADYAYVPAATATAAATAPTKTAAYRVGDGQAPGEVRVRSTGIGPLPAEAGQRGWALHVVMTMSNRGATPWRVDARRETIVLDGERVERAPLYARAAGGGPVVGVPPGTTRTLDLYYALPPEAARPSRLASFSARWRVDSAAGALAGETPFQRVNLAGPTMPCGAHATEYCLAGYSA